MPPAQPVRPAVPAMQGAPTPHHLTESCQGLVRSLAWKIKQKLPPQVELDDLIAYGQLGLVQAAHDFDPARGRQFTTYAYYRIRGAILDGLSQMAWFSRADYHRSRYERMSGELLRAETETGDETAETEPGGANESVLQESHWFADIVTKLSVVYLATADENGSHGNLLEDGREPPPAQVIAREMRERLARLVDALPPAARSLIRDTYFEGITLQQAGHRLGISKAWASRLHAKTLAQLSRSLSLAEQPCV